jgi:hypothetical protein
MRSITSAVAALAVAALLVSDAEAQSPRGAPGRGGSVSDIINSRRLLDLTPRQLAQLDSIERDQYRSRNDLRDRMMSRRDSLCANRRPCVLSREERAAFSDWANSQRPRRADMLRNDSLTRNRVMSVLDSAQRSRLSDLRSRGSGGREMQGLRERRGMREMRMRERGGAREMRGSRGMREQRGRPGMRGPQRIRPDARGFAPRRPMEGRAPMAPRFRSPQGPRFNGPAPLNRRRLESENRDRFRDSRPNRPSRRPESI